MRIEVRSLNVSLSTSGWQRKGCEVSVMNKGKVSVSFYIPGGSLAFTTSPLDLLGRRFFESGLKLLSFFPIAPYAPQHL